MKEKLTLYHYWRSSCSWRVRWALALKGVPYTAVPVNILKGEHQSADYRRKNPSGFLPCLEVEATADVAAPTATAGPGHNSRSHYFGESLAIIEWLEEAWPTPALLPSDPWERLRVRQLALTIAAGTQPLQNPALIKHYVAEEAARPEQMRHWINRGLATYDALLAPGATSGFSHGASVTLADLCLVPQIYNALRFDATVPPRLQQIYEHCLATPACAAAAPQNQADAT